MTGTIITTKGHHIHRQPEWARTPEIEQFDFIWSTWEIDQDEGNDPVDVWELAYLVQVISGALRVIRSHRTNNLPRGLRRRYGRVLTILRFMRGKSDQLDDSKIFDLGKITVAVVGLV